jgi:hypothetical protein
MVFRMLAAIVIAYHAEAGEGVDLVIGVEMPGGEWAKALLAVGGFKDFFGCALAEG